MLPMNWITHGMSVDKYYEALFQTYFLNFQLSFYICFLLLRRALVPNHVKAENLLKWTKKHGGNKIFSSTLTENIWTLLYKISKNLSTCIVCSFYKRSTKGSSRDLSYLNANYIFAAVQCNVYYVLMIMRFQIFSVGDFFFTWEELNLLRVGAVMLFRNWK